MQAVADHQHLARIQSEAAAEGFKLPCLGLGAKAAVKAGDKVEKLPNARGLKMRKGRGFGVIGRQPKDQPPRRQIGKQRLQRHRRHQRHIQRKRVHPRQNLALRGVRKLPA